MMKFTILLINIFQQFPEILSKRTVAYLNLDIAVVGKFIS